MTLETSNGIVATDPDGLLNAEASAHVLGYSGRDAVQAARRAEYLPSPTIA